MKTPIYIFAGSLIESDKIRRHYGWPEQDWVYVGKPVQQFIRGRRDRQIFFCGSWHDRPDIADAVRISKEMGWQADFRYPPRYENRIRS